MIGGSIASRTESLPAIAAALAGILHDGCISALKQNLSRFCTGILPRTLADG